MKIGGFVGVLFWLILRGLGVNAVSEFLLWIVWVRKKLLLKVLVLADNIMWCL